MKNLKFFAKIILALLPVISLVLFTFLVPFGYMDNEYPSWKYTKEIAEGRISGDASDKVSLIIGDSRAMADLVPELMDRPTINLSIGGATSIEMYYTLNSYIKKSGAPEKVIVMFAPFHYTIIDNFWTRTAYFNFLSIKDMSELYSYADATESETLLKSGYKNDLLSYRLRFPDKYLPALINSKLIGRYDENRLTYRKVSESRGYSEFGTLDGCSDLNYETNYEKMHTTKDAILLDVYMNKILRLCEDNNIETVVAIPPMNKSSYEALNPSYVEDLNSYFSALAANHPGVKVYGEIPCYDDAYFGDSSHLNRKGAEKFTKEFISRQ